MRPRLFAMTFGFALIAAPPALAGEASGSNIGGIRGVIAIERGSDELAGVAGVLGYSFGSIPFWNEIEAAHRVRFDFQTQDEAAPAKESKTNPATSALASAIVEWRNDTDFTPFACVTAGWAWNAADTRRLQLSTQVSADTGPDRDNFTYGGVLGLDWGISDSWSAGVAYRYLNLRDAESGAGNTTESDSADDYVSHDVLLSLFYRF